jgi:hypothetical protein
VAGLVAKLTGQREKSIDRVVENKRMASAMKIKTESLPKRCEICHKSDLFDAQSGHCQRCDGIKARMAAGNTCQIRHYLMIAVSITSISAGLLLIFIIFPESLMGHFPQLLSDWLWPEIAQQTRTADQTLLYVLKHHFIRKSSSIALIWTLVIDILLLNFWLRALGLITDEPADHHQNVNHRIIIRRELN